MKYIILLLLPFLGFSQDTITYKSYQVVATNDTTMAIVTWIDTTVVQADTILWRNVKATQSSEHSIGVISSDITNVGGLLDADVKGGATNLNERLSTIGEFASQNVGGYFNGQYYDNSPTAATGNTAVSYTFNTVTLAPYTTNRQLKIDQIGAVVSTANATGTFVVCIYSNSSSGWPDSLLFTSTTMSTVSAVGVVASCNFTFKSGVTYWIGLMPLVSNTTFKALSQVYSYNLGATGISALTYYSTARRAVSGILPTKFNMVNADRNAIVVPKIIFRANN